MSVKDMAEITARHVEKETEPPQFRHNWLYSVLPIGSQLYLSGYCRPCDQAFSKIIPHSIKEVGDWEVPGNNILVTKMDIPKWGCVDPATL